MTPPTRQHHDNPDEPYDGDASEPEVHYYKDDNKPSKQKPSQAEGDRETIEEDLKSKE